MRAIFISSLLAITNLFSDASINKWMFETSSFAVNYGAIFGYAPNWSSLIIKGKSFNLKLKEKGFYTRSNISLYADNSFIPISIEEDESNNKLENNIIYFSTRKFGLSIGYNITGSVSASFGVEAISKGYNGGSSAFAISKIGLLDSDPVLINSYFNNFTLNIAYPYFMIESRDAILDHSIAIGYTKHGSVTRTISKKFSYLNDLNTNIDDLCYFDKVLLDSGMFFKYEVSAEDEVLDWMDIRLSTIFNIINLDFSYLNSLNQSRSIIPPQSEYSIHIYIGVTINL